MSWFSKKPGIATTEEPSRRMEGLWAKCEVCSEILYRAELEKQLNVCPHCNHHMLWPARERLAALLDEGIFQEMDKGLLPEDPLSFSDTKRYRERLKATQKTTGEEEAFVSGLGKLGGRQVSVGCFLFHFMGGSMGSVVGEKITRVFERAHELKCPALVFSASGGARMQEGILSLMQMAKTSAALARFREVKQPYISVMLHPTTGGVAASFAWLGDIVLAEPKALIGFAGPRVIEQTIRQKLPEGFQRSEFLLEHGMVDSIVPRKEMRPRLIQLLELLA
ncbi:MAG: acetyl-CoA carboxylase, carboxyltransferase subunit beta [Proteobacteria bacterium]|nr:acetyl-CoA carboxylase, carboxyltransferase subunit beta [Pseudomonadota bacterium]